MTSLLRRRVLCSVALAIGQPMKATLVLPLGPFGRRRREHRTRGRSVGRPRSFPQGGNSMAGNSFLAAPLIL